MRAAWWPLRKPHAQRRAGWARCPHMRERPSGWAPRRRAASYMAMGKYEAAEWFVRDFPDEMQLRHARAVYELFSKQAEGL